jgi:hypothetical protein
MSWRRKDWNHQAVIESSERDLQMSLSSFGENQMKCCDLSVSVFVLMVAVVFLAGCDRPVPLEPAESSWEVIAESDMTPSLQGQLDRAMGAKEALFTALKQRLMEVASEEGPVAAIEVCSKEAAQIAAGVSDEHDLKIGRTSFRLRNRENRPPEWAVDLVANQVAQPTYLVRDGDLAVLLPIQLQAECVLCHGDKEKLMPAVRDALAENYPQDEATGFKAGDLRGWFWMEVPVGTEDANKDATENTPAAES